MLFAPTSNIPLAKRKLFDEKKSNSESFIFILLIVTVVIFFFGLFQYFKKTKPKRLKEKLEDLEERKRHLLHFAAGENQKVIKLEKASEYSPYIVRTLFVLLIVAYDCILIHVYPPNNSLLKDITLYNATLLSGILFASFIFKGKLLKIEDIVSYISNKVDNWLFNYYFPKTERRINSGDAYKEDIQKLDIEIASIKIKLSSFEGYSLGELSQKLSKNQTTKK